MSPTPSGPTPLKRLGGGRWQTRDDRFTIEPQSGTWVVVDAEQTDDLGLPLVRGPFGSLNAAKAAIETARETPAVVSPLGSRARSAARPVADPTTEPVGKPTTSPVAEAERRVAKTEPPVARAEPPVGRPPANAEPPEAKVAPEPAEPRWLTDLDPADRRRARRLIQRLVADGARDPQGIVRRDIAGNVASTAAYAVRAAIEGLDRGASPAVVARLLADGRDDELGVRWRLVDDRGRPIPLDLDALDRWAASAAEASHGGAAEGRR